MIRSNKKKISFTSSVTQPISTYEIATVWNTSKDIRRKVSFSFEKAVTDHQLSVIKKQFKGQTIDSVNLDGDQNVTLSFVQKEVFQTVIRISLLCFRIV